MSDYLDQTNDGNVPAQDTTPDQSGGEQKFNAGAIRKSTQQNILKIASQATGMDFDSVEGMAAALARLSVQQNSVASVQPSQADQSAKRTTVSDIEQRFNALQQDLARKDQAIRERDLESEIRSSLGDKIDPDFTKYAIDLVKANIQWEDGAYKIVDNRGQVRFGDDYNPLTISGLVNEVAKSNPKILKQAQSSQGGSGLRPRQGNFGAESEAMPDFSTDPDAFKAWAQRRGGLGRGQGLKGFGLGAKIETHNDIKRF